MLTGIRSLVYIRQPCDHKKTTFVTEEVQFHGSVINGNFGLATCWLHRNGGF